MLIVNPTNYGLLSEQLRNFKQEQGGKDKAVWSGASSISGLEVVHGHTLRFHFCGQRLASIHDISRATTLSQSFMERCHRQSAPPAGKMERAEREASRSRPEELQVLLGSRDKLRCCDGLVATESAKPARPRVARVARGKVCDSPSSA